MRALNVKRTIGVMLIPTATQPNPIYAYIHPTLACENNQRIIQDALEQYAIEHPLSVGTKVSLTNLVDYIHVVPVGGNLRDRSDRWRLVRTWCHSLQPGWRRRT